VKLTLRLVLVKVAMKEPINAAMSSRLTM